MDTLTIPISIKPENIIRYLKKQDKNSNYQLDKLIYYPYYFFKYKTKAKSLLKMDGYLGCTIDSISTRGAIIDHSPTFVKENVQDEDCLPFILKPLEAKKIAEDYLHHTASLKLKFFTMPKMILEQQDQFFRPFWIISDQNNRENFPPIIIDAVSGKYHPLNL